MGRERWAKTDFAGMAATNKDREFKQGSDLLGRLHSPYQQIFFRIRDFCKFVPKTQNKFVPKLTLDYKVILEFFQA